MNVDEQKKIFARNLNFFINESGKQQKEVAKDLGYSPTTFNTWCMGKIIPGMGKVQKIADYFNIGKSDLLDDKLNSDASFDARILNDMKTIELIKKYYSLSLDDQTAISHIIESLCGKAEH